MAQGRKIPKRFWWAKRIFVCWLVLLAAVVITRYWWNHLAEQRLSDEIAAIHARGQRLDWLNMAPPPLPDEQNAAVYYRQAFAAMAAVQPPLYSPDDLAALPSYRAKHLAEADAILAAHAAVFDLCRQARSIPGVNWGIVHASPATLGMGFTQYGNARGLAKLLRLQAIRQAERGDSAGAVETMLDADALARAIGNDGPLIGHLVSIAIQSLNAAGSGDIAPLLNSTAGPATTQPADRQAVLTLITQLLDDLPLASLRESVIVERAWVYDGLEWVIGGGSYWSVLGSPPGGIDMIDTAPGRWLREPLMRSALAWVLPYFGDVLDRASQPNLILAEQHKRISETGLRGPKQFFAMLMFASYDQVLEITYQTLVNRRMAAIALALRLFELEKGRAADSLDQLVPEYLPSVPQDPFDPAGGPIRALLTDAKPRLYSLSGNKLDDGGVTTPTVLGRPSDIVLFLRPGDKPEGTPIYEPTSEPSTDPASADGATNEGGTN